MTTHTSSSSYLLVLTLLVVAAVPALAADAPNPATSPAPPAAELGMATEAVPAGTPAVSPRDSALEQGFGSQYGDCSLWCDGQRYVYGFVTRDQCCSGTLLCPSGSPATSYAFFPYQGFAEFCNVGGN